MSSFSVSFFCELFPFIRWFLGRNPDFFRIFAGWFLNLHNNRQYLLCIPTKKHPNLKSEKFASFCNYIILIVCSFFCYTNSMYEKVGFAVWFSRFPSKSHSVPWKKLQSLLFFLENAGHSVTLLETKHTGTGSKGRYRYAFASIIYDQSLFLRSLLCPLHVIQNCFADPQMMGSNLH